MFKFQAKSFLDGMSESGTSPVIGGVSPEPRSWSRLLPGTGGLVTYLFIIHVVVSTADETGVCVCARVFWGPAETQSVCGWFLQGGDRPQMDK